MHHVIRRPAPLIRCDLPAPDGGGARMTWWISCKRKFSRTKWARMAPLAGKLAWICPSSPWACNGLSYRGPLTEVVRRNNGLHQVHPCFCTPHSHQLTILRNFQSLQTNEIQAVLCYVKKNWMLVIES